MNASLPGRVCVLALVLAGVTAAAPPALKDETGIIRAVRSAGPQVHPGDFQRWIGHQDAYDTLVTLLKDRTFTPDWPNAIDALATISGGNRILGDRTLDALLKFATDSCYFESYKNLTADPPTCEPLPGAPMNIGEAAAAAKLEVPFAIGMLAAAAHAGVPQDPKLQDLHNSADDVLIGGRDAAFWKQKNVRWMNKDYFGRYSDPDDQRKHLCALLAKHTQQAFARLVP